MLSALTANRGQAAGGRAVSRSVYPTMGISWTCQGKYTLGRVQGLDVTVKVSVSVGNCFGTHPLYSIVIPLPTWGMNKNSIYRNIMNLGFQLSAAYLHFIYIVATRSI